MAAAVTNLNVVAEVALYGTRFTGAGWLARTKESPVFGEREPAAERSFTDAVFEAVGQLQRGHQLTAGHVRIMAPGGEAMAFVDLAEPVPTFGSLEWQRVLSETGK